MIIFQTNDPYFESHQSSACCSQGVLYLAAITWILSTKTNPKICELGANKSKKLQVTKNLPKKI